MLTFVNKSLENTMNDFMLERIEEGGSSHLIMREVVLRLIIDFGAGHRLSETLQGSLASCMAVVVPIGATRSVAQHS